MHMAAVHENLYGSVQERKLAYRTQLECKSRRDLHSLATVCYGIAANVKTMVSGEVIDGILHVDGTITSKPENMGDFAYSLISAERRAVDKRMAAKCAGVLNMLPATPKTRVPDVHNSSVKPTVHVVTADPITHSGNTGARVVVPSGSSTSISSDSPMSTVVSPEAKRHCEIGGADAVLPAVEVLPYQAELAIVAEFSSLTTKFQLEFNEALSKLCACTSHSEVKSGFAGSAIKTLWNVVSTFQNAWFPKKPKKKLQAVGDTLTGGISHQFGTPGVTSGVDFVPPACNAVPAVSVGVATRRVRARQKRRSNAVPFVTKGPASDIRHGTIVGVNHVKEFAFIRTSRNTTDFYVGQQQYHRGMAIGDEVSFCELEPRGRRRRCPEAYRVDLLARAWTWYHKPYGARKRATGL